MCSPEGLSSIYCQPCPEQLAWEPPAPCASRTWEQPAGPETPCPGCGPQRLVLPPPSSCLQGLPEQTADEGVYTAWFFKLPERPDTVQRPRPRCCCWTLSLASAEGLQAGPDSVSAVLCWGSGSDLLGVL